MAGTATIDPAINIPEQDVPNESSIDLRRVSVGRDTFANPFFWIFVGVMGTIAIQYMMRPRK